MTKANTNLSNVNWKQAAGEAFLLLLGVLLALGGQAWWEAQVERETVSEYVENLLLEVRENQAGLLNIVEEHDSYIVASTALLRGMQDIDSADSSFSMQEQISKLGFFNDFRPATSALDNLIGAGGLGLLESTELQLAVSKYAQSISDHNVVQAEVVEFSLRSFHPFLSDHVPLLEINFVTKVSELPSHSRFEFDPMPLVESLQFENLVLRRIATEADAKQYAQRLLDVSEKLIPLLQSES